MDQNLGLRQALENSDNMTHEELYGLRLKHRKDPKAQELIAPMEHAAFAREQGDNGVVDPLVTGFVLNPGYQMAKIVGADKLFFDRDEMTTPSSFAELFGGMRGGLQGATRAIKRYIK